MAEKKVSVRLSAVGGRQVRAELEGIGDAGATIADITGDAESPGFPATLFCGPDGALYFTVGGGNSLPILRVDPDAFRETARFG